MRACEAIIRIISDTLSWGRFRFKENCVTREENRDADMVSHKIVGRLRGREGL